MTGPGPATEQRRALLAELAAAVPHPDRTQAVLVGVDGRDGAGKTVLADELAAVLSGRGRVVVRVSLDGFHRPRRERYRRGRDSAECFFLDSYDLAAFRREVVQPFTAPDTARHISRRVVHDVGTDRPVEARAEPVPASAVPVVDGLFLHRDELALLWDYSALLEAEVAETYRRMASRDGSPADPGHERNRRYVLGQELYATRCYPQTRADVVVDSTDLDRPVLVPQSRAISP